MSTWDGGESSPTPLPAARAPGWARSLELPRGWQLSTHRVAGSVSVLLETALGDTATVYVDVLTGERVADLPRGRSASALRETIRQVIALLEASESFEVQPGVAHFDGDDLSTWTPMQILALRTGARWELPEWLGGSADHTQRVNDAIKLWSGWA